MWPQQLRPQVGGVGVGVLEHRVHQRAERRADRQLGHRRGRRRRPAAGSATCGVDRSLERLVVLGRRPRARWPRRRRAGGDLGRAERGVGACAARWRRPSRVNAAHGERRRGSARRVGAGGRHGRRPRATGHPGRATGRTARRPSSSSAPAAPPGRCGLAGGAQQHPVQRRGDGVLGRRPPADDLGLGAGHRDVQQPQPLAGLLVGPAAAVVGPVGPAAADVEAAPPVVVVEERSGRLRDVAVGERGQVDDGVLAGPCWRGSSPAGPRRRRSRAAGCARRPVRRGPRPPARAARPAAPPARAARAERHLVQRLADVAQVGEPPLAADLGEHPRRAGRRRPRPRAPRRPRAARTARPSPAAGRRPRR